jgi:hypothetical protein
MITRRQFQTFAALVTALALTASIVGAANATVSRSQLGFEARTLDGSQNNGQHVHWGQAGTPYQRLAPASYADKLGAMIAGPNARAISNRVFNDIGTNLFSERGVSQWVWAWGQFLDHDLGLRDETPAESAPIPFNASDPLEDFTNDFGAVDFARTPAAPRTGTTVPRQQINTLSSFIDASNVYGTTAARLDWLRNPGAATLFLPHGYLPRVADKPNAPAVDLMGALVGTPARAAVAGDVRANENIALTAIQTLFAREHNRIVAMLPRILTDQQRFEIARRVVGAEIEAITYNEFLPAVGVRLSPYRGYNPNVDPTLTNEFATAAFRAHSMVHGEFEVEFEPGRYSAAQLDAFRRGGIEVEDDALVIPLTVAFGNPDLLESVGLGAILGSLGGERQYRNDEQIDNSMRSVLFGVPRPGTTDPTACQTPVIDPRCFSGVVDLGALDVMRGRDHGIPSYNALRKVYGLAPKTTFTSITGESTANFPPGIPNPNNNPDILKFIELRDANGVVLDPNDPAMQENAVTGVRKSTLAARLKAIYGTPDAVDAFVGMVSEPHVRGTELGELQLAIWKKQFEALRDGDRFFFANDPVLTVIKALFGVQVRTLSQIIAANSNADVAANPFVVAATPAAASSAAVASVGAEVSAVQANRAEQDGLCLAATESVG